MKYIFGGLGIACILISFYTPYLYLEIASIAGAAFFGICADILERNEKSNPTNGRGTDDGI